VGAYDYPPPPKQASPSSRFNPYYAPSYSPYYGGLGGFGFRKHLSISKGFGGGFLG
jgi:hypothetical protein